MKTKLLLTLPLLLLTSCGGKTYPFKVKEHHTAILTSEVQETTHDCYLAFCKSGANECFIEVPLNDTRETLNLKYVGYKIEYFIDYIGWVSNQGWELV